MTCLLQIAYDAALFWAGSVVVSSALERRIPRVLCAAVFPAAPALTALAFRCVPLFDRAAPMEPFLREILLLLLIVVAFKEKFFQKAFVFFALMVTAALIALAAGFGARLFFAIGPERDLCRQLGAFGLLALCFSLFLRFGRGPAGNLFADTDKLNWPLSVLGVFCSYIGVRSAQVAFQREDFHAAVFIVLIIALANLAGVFAAIAAGKKAAGESYELHLARELIASGADYYKRLDRILQEIRVLRHDYKYQIGVIEELAKISRARHILDFLADARSYYNQTEPIVYCENPVVSALLAHYAERFEENSIAFAARAVFPSEIPRVDKSLSPLNSYEICVVLGNLLENAFEALMGVPAEQRRASLDISLSAGRLLLIEAKNTFDGTIMAGGGASSFSIPRSRKRTGGGHGLRSVVAVCKRHSGEYLPEWTESEYVIRLLLNL
ncbi:MAG: GHKL domain-containing protein [Treponema sp.]|jgi:hypothetical protein|nr:GHKL domain-containing protein [Treponema sp.]